MTQTVSKTDLSRRTLAHTAVGAVGAAFLLSAGTRNAAAEQGKMEAALAQLQGALSSLHRATSDKGGHKAKAAGLIQEAMAEVQAGIDYAAQHSGD